MTTSPVLLGSAGSDNYEAGECLPDQTGAGAVLTFMFLKPQDMVIVDAEGAVTDEARIDPFGVPSVSQGFVCRSESTAYIQATTDIVRVFAPAGMVVSVNGLRRI